VKTGFERCGAIAAGLLIAAIGGVLVYLHGYNPELRDFLCGLFRQYPFAGQAAGGVLILWVLGWMNLSLHARRKARYIRFDTASGEVSVSIGAVRDYIRRVGSEFPAVLGLEPKIHAGRRGRTDVLLEVNIKAGHRVPELSEMLRTRIREGLQDELGLTGVGRIQVRIGKMVGTPERD